MRQTTLILITLLASIMTSLPVLAAWQLDNEKSQLTFMSVKKSMIAENHHFSTLAGNRVTLMQMPKLILMST